MVRNLINFVQGNIYRLLFGLLLVVLPFFTQTNNVLIVVVAAYWLIFDRHKTVGESGVLLILLLPFVSCVVGMFYAIDTAAGVGTFETYFPLLVFPVVFFTIRFSKADANFIFITFLVSSVGWALYCLIFEVILHMKGYGYLFPVNFDYFKLSELTRGANISPPYLGLYMAFALIIAAFLYTEGRMPVYVYILISVFLLLFMILSGARTAVFAAISALILFWIAHGKIKLVLVAAFFLSVMLFVMSRDIVLYNRVLDAVTLEQRGTGRSYTSLSLRLDKWNAAWSVFSENVFFGVGTGGTKAALHERYSVLGIEEAAERNYNAHNQYLETAVMLGLMGLLCLSGCLAFGFYKSFASRDWVYFFMLFIFCICLFTESMLERQRGIVFFSFFNSMLMSLLYKPGSREASAEAACR